MSPKSRRNCICIFTGLFLGFLALGVFTLSCSYYFNQLRRTHPPDFDWSTVFVLVIAPNGAFALIAFGVLSLVKKWIPRRDRKTQSETQDGLSGR